MNSNFSFEQIGRTGNFDVAFLLRQPKLNLMARFMEIKSINPKMIYKEIAKELGYSSSTLQRHRYDIQMQSPYKSNNPKRTQKTSNHLKRPQLKSIDSNENDKLVSTKVKTKSSSRGGDPNDVNPSHRRFFLNKLFLLQ